MLFSGRSTARFELRIAPDGSARVLGVIRMRDDAGLTLLVAEPDTAQAACADANGNGRSGLTGLQFRARDFRTGERVAMALTAVEGEDIDRGGLGFVTFQAGESLETVEALVAFRSRRNRRRRRGGRR